MPPSITVPGNLVAVERGGKTYGASAEDLGPQVPLEYIMKFFDARIGRAAGNLRDRVLVVRSSTGSGKSTMIPPELFHQFYERVDRRGVVCTQPRALTAADIPNQIVLYNSAAALAEAGHAGRTPLVLGQNIGFQTGPNTLRAARGINFVTTQVLVRQLGTLTDEEFMAKYAFVIVDEAHERALPLDMLLWAMRRFLQRNAGNRDCPFFIVMSATFDPFAMADYLLSGDPLRYENIIQVRGAVYEKTDEYLATDCVDIAAAVRARLINIVEAGAEDLAPLNVFRDVLIFVNDAALNREFKMIVEDLNASHPAFQAAPVRHVYLDSRAVATRNDDYRAIFTPYSGLKAVVRGKNVPAVRRVIVATNVAETGLTLETLRYMIDTGLYKSSEFNPVLGCNVLVDRPVTRGMWTQRFGRVGRKAPGFGYALFTVEARDAMLEDAHPSIVTEGLTMDLLLILVQLCDVEGRTRKDLRKALADSDFWLAARATKIDLMELDVLTVPPVDALQYSLDRLLQLGAIDCNCIPTALGFVYNSLDKITAENAAMIMAAYAWGAQPMELVTIAALVERGCVALPSWSARSAAIREVTGGDTFIDLLLTYEEYMESYGNVAARTERDVEGAAELPVDIEVLRRDTPGNPHRVGLDAEYGAGLANGAYEGGSGFAPPTRDEVFAQLARENEYRDNYMTCLAKTGFNPYEHYRAGLRTPHLDQHEIIDYVRRIKQCIFEGYRPNLAEWNGNGYNVLRSGIVIMHPHCGRFVVFGPILLMKGKYAAEHICPLDGYVNVDKQFSLR